LDDYNLVMRAIKTAVDVKLEAFEKVKAIILDAKAQQGNLRKLTGKKYEDLTPEDIQRLATIWHRDDEPVPCQLCRYIAINEMKKRKEGR